MTREKILEELGQLQDLSYDIEIVLHNAQNVQNGLSPQGHLPNTTNTISQMPPLSSYPITTFQTFQTSTIPLFRPILPPSQTFIPLDQSLWIDGPSSIPQTQER
ncbi:hypothetical protein Tco_0108195, partial [Tanacetum coccineum]